MYLPAYLHHSVGIQGAPETKLFIERVSIFREKQPPSQTLQLRMSEDRIPANAWRLQVEDRGSSFVKGTN